MREWLCRSRKRRKRILHIRGNFKQFSFLVRETRSLMHEEVLSMHRNRAWNLNAFFDAEIYPHKNFNRLVNNNVA